MTILEARGLSKRYQPDAPLAVDNVSYSIAGGEIFSLLGPNGAGKTTTIAMLSGLIPPTAGDGFIGGHSIIRETMAAKKLIGVVPQDIALYPTLSARQNLVFWGKMYGLGGRPLQARVDEVLAQIGLSDRANDPIETYSGGMKRRVNIGAGLLHKPQIVFMDEPTVGIDPQSRRAILEMTKSLNAEGMAVLYTTHYMEEAQELSHRIGIQDHGKLIALGTFEELIRLVGGSDSIRLSLNRPANAIQAPVEALTGVQQVLTADYDLTVMVDEANTRLVDILAVLNRQQVHINRIDIQEPNLEAVFLHLTGRALRD